MRSLVVACGALFFVLVGIYLSERKHAMQLANLGTSESNRVVQPVPAVPVIPEKVDVVDMKNTLSLVIMKKNATFVKFTVVRKILDQKNS